MGNVSSRLEINVPVRTAYNQWTQFEEFPRFMDNTTALEQLTDTRIRWTTNVWGVERTFDATITEQDPDQRIAWKADGDVTHAGVVTFHRKDDEVTVVQLDLDVEPADFLERAADALGIIERQAEKDLANFKEFIEERGHETGAWRGEVVQDSLT